MYFLPMLLLSLNKLSDLLFLFIHSKKLRNVFSFFFFPVLRIQIRNRIRMFSSLGSASGSISHKYWSGSGSFHHQAKIRKTLISTVLWHLYDFLSLNYFVNVPVFRIRIRKLLGLQDPHQDDPLVRGADPRIQIRIRIHNKMSRIRNIALFSLSLFGQKSSQNC